MQPAGMHVKNAKNEERVNPGLLRFYYGQINSIGDPQPVFQRQDIEPLRRKGHKDFFIIKGYPQGRILSLIDACQNFRRRTTKDQKS